MPRRRRHLLRPIALSAGLAVAALALGGSAASAQSSCTGQSGTSALEQYCEAVPRADGTRERPTGNQGAASGPSVSNSTAQALAKSGADGAAVAALASGAAGGSSKSSSKPKPKASESKSSEASSATNGSGGSSADAGAVKGVRVEGPKDPSANPLKAATAAAQSGPVAGPTLVWGLVGLSTVGAIAAVVLRRRESLAPPGHDDAA